MNGPFLAVDWGTTNRRVYLVEAGEVRRTERDAMGILAVGPEGFADAVMALRASWGDAPMLLAGMVGSDRGWMDAGYVGCPATLADLAARLVSPAPNAWIVPGVSVAAERSDVMRGEEVQLLGAVAAGLAPADAVLCQPGTHCKWAWMQDGKLRDFRTAMTGELFALLQQHALIGRAMTAPVAAGAAFLEGVADSADGRLLQKLFAVRAASVLRRRPDAEAASYVSGLLIGSDCRGAVAAGETVHVLADEQLGGLYAAALENIGAAARRVDSHAAFVAGMSRIWELKP